MHVAGVILLATFTAPWLCHWCVVWCGCCYV